MNVRRRNFEREFARFQIPAANPLQHLQPQREGGVVKHPGSNNPVKSGGDAAAGGLGAAAVAAAAAAADGGTAVVVLVVVVAGWTRR